MPNVRAEVRREQVILAAKSVIAEHGVEGATTRRIAAAAGAPLASLHYCFHSKEELFFAIWEEQLRELRARVSRPARGTGLGHAAAIELREVMEWMVSEEEFAIATTELLLWALRQDRSLGIKSYEIHFEARVERFRASMAPGDSETLVAPLARMVIAAVDGLTLQWLTYHDRDRLEEGIRLWEEAIEHLAAARNTSSRSRRTQATPKSRRNATARKSSTPAQA